VKKGGSSGENGESYIGPPMNRTGSALAKNQNDGGRKSSQLSESRNLHQRSVGQRSLRKNSRSLDYPGNETTKIVVKGRGKVGNFSYENKDHEEAAD